MQLSVWFFLVLFAYARATGSVDRNNSTLHKDPRFFDAIGDFLSDIGDAIYDTVTDVGSAVYDTVSDAVDWIDGDDDGYVFDDIGDAIYDSAVSIGGAISGVVDGAVEWIDQNDDGYILDDVADWIDQDDDGKIMDDTMDFVSQTKLPGILAPLRPFQTVLGCFSNSGCFGDAENCQNPVECAQKSIISCFEDPMRCAFKAVDTIQDSFCPCGYKIDSIWCCADEAISYLCQAGFGTDCVDVILGSENVRAYSSQSPNKVNQ
jgi:hypothetical protein